MTEAAIQHCGAFGTLTVTRALPEWTSAQLFQRVGTRCRVLVRFSSVSSGPDAFSDPHGFALRFYTQEGNWDLLGSSVPVSAVRDIRALTELWQAQKRDEQSGRRSPTRLVEFWNEHPEALHQVLHLFGPEGQPPSYRQLQGYGVHTYSLARAQGEVWYVKWQLISQQSREGVVESPRPQPPTALARDLWEALERGEYPRWTLALQLMSAAEAQQRPEAFDPTKLWPPEEFPLIPVGELLLHENPKHPQAEIEQAVFDPAHLPPGLGGSQDPLGQNRLLNLAETQQSGLHQRLGANYASLPVNQERGLSYLDLDQRFSELRPDEPPEMALLWSVAEEGIGYAQDERDFYIQPRSLYVSLGREARLGLAQALASLLLGIPSFVKDDFVEHLQAIHPQLAEETEREHAKLRAKPKPSLFELLEDYEGPGS